jgi:Peptidase inhibitor I9
MRRIRPLLALAGCSLLCAALPGVAAATPTTSYVVALNPGQLTCDQATATVVSTYGLKPRNAYKDALCGFSAPLTPEQLTAVAADPLVAYVQVDARTGSA